MANAIFLEVLACFLLATGLLHRYCDMVNSNIVTVVGVFTSWFFSFMIIFILPADLTSTAYRTCLDFNSTVTNDTIPINNGSSPIFPTNNTNTNILPQNPITNSIHEYSTQLNDNHYIMATNFTDHECIVPWNLVPRNSLTLMWRLIYWTSQFLSWLLLPIMQSYSKSGEFDNVKKFKYAIRSNLIYYSSLGAIFIVFFVHFIVRNGIPTLSNLRLLMISSSNTWGLFLLVVLLGYGLVELPRYLLDRSRYSQYLNRLYFQVASLNAEKCEADEKLDDALEEVHQAYTVLGASEHNFFTQYLNQIVEKCPDDLKNRLNTFRRQAASSNTTYRPDESRYSKYDMQSMIRLHQKVINAVHHHGQTTCRWRHIIEDVIAWEDVAKNQMDHESLETRTFKSSLPKPKSLFLHLYTPTVEWYWKCVIRVWVLRVTGAMMAFFSMIVVISEIAFPISVFGVKISLLALIMDGFQNAQQYFYLELFSILSIGYLAICAFYTVFNMKIFNIYYLASNKQTDEYSLLFSGMLVCRLTAPLCLNYLCLVYRDSLKKEETSFTTIMGHLDLIPFVKQGLYVFMPLCISAICLAIYFNVGNHFLHKFGFERFIEDDEITIDLIQTGRDLVVREKGKLLRHYDPNYSLTSSTGPNSHGHNQQQQPKSNIPEANDGNLPLTTSALTLESPTSSSSSSDYSRSSLLPRSANKLSSNTTNDPWPSTASDTNIQIEPAKSSSQNIAGSSGHETGHDGFFDDV